MARSRVAGLLGVVACLGALAGTGRAEVGWPRFRGPDGLGVAELARPPIHFGAASNVLWRLALPPGHSSPCIWQDRIFLTGLEGNRLETCCIARRAGKLLWRVAVTPEKLEPVHQRLGHPASPTPATDGQRVYVYFGSFGLLAYDYDGKEVWRRPLPMPVIEYGTSSSPILAGGLLVVNCDQDLNSYLLAVEPATGKTVWRAERPEFPRGFTTPFLWRLDGVQELVVAGTVWLKAYDVRDGQERWKVRGLTRVVCPSPIAGEGLLFMAAWSPGADAGNRIVMPPYAEFAREHDRNKDGVFGRDEVPNGPFLERFSQLDVNKDKAISEAEWKNMEQIFAQAQNCLLAVRPGGRGDITATHVVWRQTRGLPYVPCPLYYRGRVYLVKDGGLVSCYQANNGHPVYLEERLGALGDYYASPVAADGRIYAASLNGAVVVFAAGDTLEVLARNNLGESVLATPAILEDKLYIRSATQLWAFGDQAGGP